MTSLNAEDWLEAWADENIQTPQYHENKHVMKREAAMCSAAAEADGISQKDLVEAAGGDLLEFLLNRQNEFTDAEVHRKAAQDD